MKNDFPIVVNPYVVNPYLPPNVIEVVGAHGSTARMFLDAEPEFEARPLELFAALRPSSSPFERLLDWLSDHDVATVIVFALIVSALGALAIIAVTVAS